MSENKLVRIMDRLYKRTEKGEVAWEATVEDGEFQAAFADYSVKIVPRFKTRYATEPDYVLQIFNADGQLLDETSNVDLEEEREEYYEMMKELYSGARRKALRVDTALDSILDELET